MSHLELCARLTVRPGQLEGFRNQVAEIVRLARELDNDTIRFDWFLSEDGTHCEVHETYENEDAFFSHAQHIMAARTKLFRDFADGHQVTAFGDVPPRFLEMANAHAGGLEQFSFLQGLELQPMV